MSADGVGDGQAALGLLVQAAGAGEPYRLAFLERGLPDMTGVELARRIQALPSLADLSLILVDNQAEPGQWREAQAAGMVATIEKPVSQDGLSRCLDQVLGVQAPVGGRGAGPGLGARVLLVDDNAMNLVLAEAHLANLGYQVTLAGDGASALAAAADGGFDLIFMDCCMPVMDGFEATRRLRASEAGGRRTPVIAMTANALPSDRDDCMAAGMDDFLPKPYSKAELVAVLERWAPRRAAPAAGAPPPGAAAATAGETGVGGDDSNLPEVLDPTTLQRLIAEHRGGVALLGRLLGLFWEDGGKQLAQIERALAEGDDETLVRAAHTLKSSSATLGAGRLAEIARQIERAARAGQRAGLAERAAVARCAFDAARAAQARFLAEAGV